MWLKIVIKGIDGTNKEVGSFRFNDDELKRLKTDFENYLLNVCRGGIYKCSGSNYPSETVEDKLVFLKFDEIAYIA